MNSDEVHVVKEYVSLALRLCCLALVITAAGLWAGAGVDYRRKYRDEQTLVGGMIWSQIIIPMGLLLSTLVKERLDPFVMGYFLLTGVMLCVSTGVVLIIGEIKTASSSMRQTGSVLNMTAVKYDKIYLMIAILSLVTGAMKFVQFLLLFI